MGQQTVVSEAETYMAQEVMAYGNENGRNKRTVGKVFKSAESHV